MSTTDSPEQPQGRLDREINEILEQSSKRPISFEERVARKRATVQRQQISGRQRLQQLQTGPLRSIGSWALRVPLVTALVVALIAVWVAPQSGLLGGLLGIVAAALIFVPYVRSTGQEDITYQKRWRGRVISSSPSAGGPSRSWMDSIRDRIGR